MTRYTSFTNGCYHELGMPTNKTGEQLESVTDTCEKRELVRNYEICESGWLGNSYVYDIRHTTNPSRKVVFDPFSESYWNTDVLKQSNFKNRPLARSAIF